VKSSTARWIDAPSGPESPDVLNRTGRRRAARAGTAVPQPARADRTRSRGLSIALKR
jgi:hypothetical protein